jgi:hypothetical protein
VKIILMIVLATLACIALLEVVAGWAVALLLLSLLAAIAGTAALCVWLLSKFLAWLDRADSPSGKHERMWVALLILAFLATVAIGIATLVMS